MTIELHPTFQGGNIPIEQTISFHQSQETDQFYQESIVPFSITTITCHSDDHSLDVYSIFVPGAQYNGTLLHSISGREPASMHQHNYFELVYVLQGNMYQIVEGKEFLYPAGSCCILNRNTLHTELFSSDYHALFFTITADLISDIMKPVYPMFFTQERGMEHSFIAQFFQDNLQSLHESTRDFLDFVPRITEHQQKILVHDIFENMIHTMISPCYGSTFHVKDLLCQLLSVLSNADYYQAVHATANTSMDSLLFARIDQILEEHNGRISNHELSKMLSYNGTYLGRIVKNHTGMSLFDYSMTFTMKAASDLLLNTNKNVSQIMEELHFSNRTHFYQVFSQYYQMTPAQYRQAGQK